MKIRVSFWLLTTLFFADAFFLKAQTSVVLQENFTNYMGTPATVPAGWYFSYNGNYTSTAFSGISGPNSYRFGVNNATIVTPGFANADSISFWIKASVTDTISYLNIYESPDSIAWNLITQIKPVPSSGTPYQFPVNNSSTHLKIFYFKSAANLAFDDFLLLKYTPYISSGDIKIYFTHPVDTSVSGGVNAVYLNQTLDDTLIAYINRAKYTLDIAVFNYVQTPNFSNIANAIDSAHSRGVKVRWIYNGSSFNTGISLLDTNIKTLPSPTLSNYGLMHNKFMIMDAKSADANDAFVWTGSCNWTEDQFNYDVNNAIIIQDKYLGLAYTNEFNEMWGDTGLAPNTVFSKFGPYKTDNTQHIFTIRGKAVELYFSPSDNTNDKILSSIGSANSDLYFGVYAFTLDTDADSIKSKIQDGVYSAGILDQFSQTYSSYSILQPVMGNNLKVFTNGSSLYHNKFLIVDPCDSLSDPLVLTGSHNWSSSADTKNDENTLLIHDDTIANIYYQSFYRNFSDLSGTLAPCVSMAANEISNEKDLIIFPNPTTGKLQVTSYKLQVTSVEAYNVLGQKVNELMSEKGNKLNQTTQPLNNSITIDLTSQPSGIYFLKIKTEKDIFFRKIIIGN